MRTGKLVCLALLTIMCGGLAGCREELGKCSGQDQRLCVRITLGAVPVPDLLSFHVQAANKTLEQAVSQGVSEAFAARGAYILEVDLNAFPDATVVDTQVSAQRLGQDSGRGSGHYEAGQPQPLEIELQPSTMGPVGPYITQLTPPSGPTTGAITLSIHGGNFVSGSGLAVRVGDSDAPNPSWISAAEVSAVLPPGSFGPTTVVVKNPDGQQTLPAAFRYYYGQLSFTSRLGVGTGGTSMLSAVTAVDWDGNGQANLAVVNQVANNVFLLRNSGRTFVAIPTRPGVGPEPVAIAAGRFNGDTLEDLVVANKSSAGLGSISLLLSTGGGAFAPQYTMNIGVVSGNQPVALAPADFDGDGKLDLAVLSQGDTKVTVLKGADGTFFPGPLAEVGTGTMPIAIVALDFNKDNHPDLAVATGRGIINLYAGTGNGMFSTLPNLSLTGYTPVGLVAADLDGDSRPDLIVPLGDGKRVYVLWGTGSSPFYNTDTALTTLSLGEPPTGVAVADFNRDERLDLAVSNSTDGTVNMYLGSGMRGFNQASTGFSVGFGASCCILSRDFDADGRPDLAVLNPSRDNVGYGYNTAQ